ncbi:MAG: TonB C-terminal domain-containing protein [Betaproteobacteria bacterium]
MYFDFEDYRPDIAPVGRAISWREGILISIIVHLAMIIVLLLSPKLFEENAAARRARLLALQQQRQQQAARFVFVQPRVDIPALKPPVHAENSDKDRQARTVERAPKPENRMPFSRGNSPERVEAQQQAKPRGQGPQPEPSAGQVARNARAAPPGDTSPRIPDSSSGLQIPNLRQPAAPQNGASGRAATAGGALGDALKNLQRYVQHEQFDNATGGGEFGPAIQFDTKGVEFGPWIRRFVAQIRRNWFIPYAAMSMKGHVVITFNVHKDGSISDLAVVGPCPVDAFNNAAFGALVSSNPTQPLPPEYPSEKAFFTVTFYYNEQPQ